MFESSSWVSSSLAFKNQTRKKVTDIDKDSTLLYCCLIYIELQLNKIGCLSLSALDIYFSKAKIN